jgi:hypothetical protein
VPLYLIKIDKRKWDRRLPWLRPGEIQADPLGDLNVLSGQLSVWHIEDNRSNLDLVAVGLAISRGHIAKFEYCLFDQEVVENIGLKVDNSVGSTPVTLANQWHRDLTELTVDSLVVLVKTIFSDLEKQRIYEQDVWSKVIAAAKAGSIDMDKVKGELRNAILVELDKDARPT